MQLKFGKYKGKDLKQIAKENPRYILWMLSGDEIATKCVDDEARRFCIDILAGDLRMPFGRHEGKTLRLINAEVRSYIEWLMMQPAFCWLVNWHG